MRQMHIQQNKEGRDSRFQPLLRGVSIRNDFHFKPDPSQCFRKDAREILIIFDNQG
jgi:hypothetical protein